MPLRSILNSPQIQRLCENAMSMEYLFIVIQSKI